MTSPNPVPAAFSPLPHQAGATPAPAHSPAPSFAQLDAHNSARQPVPGTVQKDPRGYVRVSVRKPAPVSTTTTVSVGALDWAAALHYARGDARAITDALRYVAARVSPEQAAARGFSALVVQKALHRLRGLAPSAAERLAAENNAAWGTDQ